jgi:hypothetical protein
MITAVIFWSLLVIGSGLLVAAHVTRTIGRREKTDALIRRLQNVFEWLPKDHPRYDFLDGVFFGLCWIRGYGYERHIENVLKEVEKEDAK